MAPYTPARYIDLHVLHPLPASLLNRGEDNEPKTIVLGGAVRAMVSSQAWKRPIRLHLEQDLDEHATRTRKLPPHVADALRADGWPEDLAAFAGAQIARSATTAGLKTEENQGGITSAILWMPRDVLHDLTALCHDNRAQLEEALTQEIAAKAARSSGKTKKKTGPPAVLPTAQIAALIRRRTATINLFGRMLAELPGAHVDGAVQMAHAFTVHQSDPQPDYFTTVDDWSAPDEPGSAHLQTGFLTTGLLYRYATVNLTELTRNLNGDSDQALRLLSLFAEAFTDVMPGAKKTSTAPHTLPHLVHYAVRDRRPVSYAAAFERPVRHAPGGGHTQPAVEALSQYAGALNQLFGTRRLIAHGYATFQPGDIDHLGPRHTSFEELTDTLTQTASQPAETAAHA
ncbi:type I-E CRISPR-associated protein Cas7/Cse4/CasC [Streptomyces europaeiscabiei]|uniref:type I-E CRISPR-associated protein Cas7/Cse4/CasC n=1 Tax=Streptomyces europaeiscabiei TaxID=146819 RepID=UPI00062847C2|nr:type I-E CRISPR-associated protein Cas7/Cse4/CasC [Streptomyces europaeiscabiei]